MIEFLTDVGYLVIGAITFGGIVFVVLALLDAWRNMRRKW